MIRLLLIRHGTAEDPAAWNHAGHPEAERPLTRRGAKRMKRVVAGLRHLVPTIDTVATSPLRRAARTAEIVREGFKGPPPVVLPQLQPGAAFDAVNQWLATAAPDATIALVGHEPDLSRLAAVWMFGQAVDAVELKKGGVLLLTFDHSPEPAGGKLRWLLRPAHLRGLAD